MKERKLDKPMPDILDTHSKELTLIALIVLVLATLMVIVPQLLRAHMRKMEMLHAENLKMIEAGIKLPMTDDRSRLAGRMALLVPMVVMITAGAVTSFLAIYGSEHIFPVSLGVWVVAGVVSLAAITGGVALVGRLAHLDDEEFDEADENYSGSPMAR
jgi:hypothetical protein